MCPAAIDEQISDLALNPSPALTDVFAIDNASRITYKSSGTQLLNLIQANIQIAESQVTNLVTDLAGKSPLAGSTSLITVGTVTTGNWQASTISSAYGGTGFTSYTDGQILVGQTSSGNLIKGSIVAGTGATVSFNNSTGVYTIATGAGSYVTSISATAPITASASTGDVTIGINNATTTTLGSASFPSTYFSVSSGAVTPNNFTINTSAPLTGGGAITLGGTLSLAVSNATTSTVGVASFNSTNFTVTTGAVTSNAITVTSGNNITATASWNLGGSVSISVSGTTNHALQLGNASGSLTSLGVATNGQLPIGSTGADPVLATLTPGTGISITNGAGSITIATDGSATLSTLTGNTGGAISPTAGNINTVGTGSITIAGSGSTLTTQLTGLTNHNVLVGAGTATITNVAPSATSGIPLISQGASADPTFGTAVVAGGGTGAVSFTAHSLLLGQGTSAITALGAATNGQLPIGSTGTDPVLATISSGNNITVTNGAGTISVAVTGTTNHAVQVGNASGSLTSLAVGTTGQVLAGNTGADPTWQNLSSLGVTSISATAPLTANSVSGSAQTGAVTIALTTPVSLDFGGTNANLTASNGGIFYSTATAGAILSGTATASKMLLSGASAAPTWSTSTIPSSAGATANKVLLSDGTNYVLSTPTFPNASATSGKIIISDGTNWIASTPTFPNSATGTGTILRADGTNWAATTATYPATTTINQILYSSSANVIGGITASNNGVLISGTTGIPSWLAAGTTGQVLIATTSNPASWGTLSSIAVTSITGTANQITASASTGAVTLSLPSAVVLPGTLKLGGMVDGTLNNVLYLGNISTKTTTGSLTGATDYTAVTGTGGVGSPFIVGWRFTPTADILVTKLQVLDAMFPSGSRDVALYTTGGAQIATASVAKTDTLNGKYREKTITSQILTSGTSYVVLVVITAADTWVTTVSAQTVTNVTFGSGRYNPAQATLPTTDNSSDVGTANPVCSILAQPAPDTFTVTSSSGNTYVGGGLGVGYTSAPPTNGAIIQGRAAIGTSSPSSSIRFTVSAATTDVYGSFITGTQNTDDGASIIGFLVNTTLSPTNNNKSVYGIYCTPSATPVSTNTITNSYAVFSQLGGTIGSGVVTNSYSGSFLLPSLGTNKHALHADNFSVGASYIGAVAPPTSGAIIQGQLGVGTSTPGSYFVNISPPSPAAIPYVALVSGTLIADDGFNEQFGLAVSPNYSPNQTNTTNFFNVICQPTATLSVNSTQYTGIYHAPTIATTGSNFSMTNFYGIRMINPSKTGSGVITNAYNGYYIAPTIATNNTALYADNLSIGYTGVTPGTNYGLVKGRAGIGTSAPSYKTEISGDGNASYVNSALGLTNTGGTTRTYVIGPRGDGILYFADDTAAVIRLLLDTNGNFVVNTGALATNATTGFLYIPTCAGTPTGTPTTYTGRGPLIYDSTNNKLYFYNGAWKGVTLT
jgi:hypothetical protein